MGMRFFVVVVFLYFVGNSILNVYLIFSTQFCCFFFMLHDYYKCVHGCFIDSVNIIYGLTHTTIVFYSLLYFFSLLFLLNSFSLSFEQYLLLYAVLRAYERLWMLSFSSKILFLYIDKVLKKKKSLIWNSYKKWVTESKWCMWVCVCVWVYVCVYLSMCANVFNFSVCSNFSIRKRSTAYDSIHHRHHDGQPNHVSHGVAMQLLPALISTDKHTFDTEAANHRLTELADHCTHTHRMIHLYGFFEKLKHKQMSIRKNKWNEHKNQHKANNVK